MNEDQAAQRILEVVPRTFRAEVQRHLRVIQAANWLDGWHTRDRVEEPMTTQETNHE